VEDVILVAGEALFDLVPGDGDDVLAAHPGGGPFNAARTLGRLQRPVAYLGRLSRDRFGARLRALLDEDGVRPDTIVDTDEPTTLALVEVDQDGVAAYRFYSEGTSAAGLEPAEALATLPAEVSMVHAGTLGFVFEPTAAALEAVIERLHGSALIAIDPNCRPHAIPDRDAYRARLDRVLALADLVKVSEEDAEYLSPGTPPVDAVRGLLAQGPSLGLLTRGPGGAVVVTAEAEVAVPAPRTKVIDTIGAGDAFGGGFLAWWHEHGLGADDLTKIDSAVEATRFACLVAARTCAKPGASPPFRSEL
jgi:fructokinase